MAVKAQFLQVNIVADVVELVTGGNELAAALGVGVTQDVGELDEGRLRFV